MILKKVNRNNVIFYQDYLKRYNGYLFQKKLLLRIHELN